MAHSNINLNKAIKEQVIPKGFKLGTSVTHRKITDQALAAKVLVEKGLSEDELWKPREMKSIPALAKLGTKGQVESWLGSLIQRPEGSPKLIRVKETAKDDFE